MRNRQVTRQSEIMKALERGELKRVANAATEQRAAGEAAAAYLRKDARINVRLSGSDLKLLKRRAAEEGIRYQTLIASVLHKFVTGRLQSGS